MWVLSLLSSVSLYIATRAETACKATEDNAFIQAAFLRIEDKDNHSDTLATDAHWSWSDFQELLDSLNPAKIQVQLRGMLDDPNMSLEEMQEKLSGFAKDFSGRLQQTVSDAEQKIADLQVQAKSQTQAVKIQALSSITDKITTLGRTAVEVAGTITGKVEEAQGAVTTALNSIHNSKSPEKAEELQQALDTQVQALIGFVDQLKQAMNRGNLVSLLSGTRLNITVTDATADMRLNITVTESTAELPDAVAKTEAQMIEALEESSKVLDAAKIYVAFVNKTINEAEEKALILSNQTASDASKMADETIDRIANELTALLQKVTKMVKGEYDLAEAQAYVEKSGARALMAPAPLLGVFFMFMRLMGRLEE